MSAIRESTQITELTEDNWGVLLAGGVLLAAFGVLAIAFPLATGLSLSLVFGAVLVAGGLIHVGHAFGVGGWKAIGWHGLLAVVYAVAGIALLTQPLLGLVTLTAVLIGFFAAEGVIEIALGLRSRSFDGWQGIVLSGVVSLVLAGIILSGFPQSAVWALGIVFGANLVVTGVSFVFFGLRNRPSDLETEPIDEGAGKPIV
ncbi:MAG: HdeD family acid-resistance protein [Halobacteriota archaeon]